MSTLADIKAQIQKNPMILYLKGTPQFPQCRFSGKVVHVMGECAASYAYVNVLEHPDIRAELPKVADWPTFPQLFLQGELIGGCDILTQLHESGELQKMLVAAKVTSDKPCISNAI